ncbi:MAG: metal-dependent hydrolase [Planctomycetes bacterium]|nr:metal-dependent hydrolase [Planctomycetota bacterium]
MHFAQHFVISWFAGEKGGAGSVAGRRIVTWAGVVSDADVIPYAGAIAYNWLGKGMPFGEAMQSAFDTVHIKIHHHYTHNFAFVLLVGLVSLFLAMKLRSRAHENSGIETDKPAQSHGSLRVAILAMFACSLHIACDAIASGPEWPVYPFWPLSDYAWGYKWSWTLADWPNIAILAACLVLARQYAKAKGRSPVEAFSVAVDRRFVRLVRGEVGKGE